MRDGLMFFCFLTIFLIFLVSGISNRERHDKMMDEIQKLEYKVDSVQSKCDSIQNIIFKIDRNV